MQPFSWYASILLYANNEPMKIPAALKMNAYDFLDYLKFEKAKSLAQRYCTKS